MMGKSILWIQTGLIAALCLSVAACTVHDGEAFMNKSPITKEEMAGRKTHYVDFRTRASFLPIGHHYAAIGKLDENGKPVPATEKTIGFTPKQGLVGALVGAVIEQQPEIHTDGADLERPLVSSFRTKITAAQHKRMMAVIRRFRADPPKWGMWTFNCNHFMGLIATTIGLKTPDGVERWGTAFYYNVRLAMINGL